jgi:hypothetical protein
MGDETVKSKGHTYSTGDPMEKKEYPNSLPTEVSGQEGK